MPRSTLLGRPTPSAVASPVSPWPVSPPSRAAWPPPPRASAATVWDRVAACESGGNWSINTGNGYYGGLQFSDRTWDGFGGERYAATANRATKAQQITIAQKVLAVAGARRLADLWRPCRPDPRERRRGQRRLDRDGTRLALHRRARLRRTARAGKLAVDGIRGPKTNAAIERWVGGSVNGTLSRTDVKALQRKVGSAPDGVIGPKTIRALQTKIGARKNGSHSLDRATVRSLQSYLNAR